MLNSNKKLFFAIMFSDRTAYNNCIKVLNEKFGEIENEGCEYDFDNYTDYYEDEMGKGLIKKIIIIKKSIREGQLKNIKLLTSEIEKKFSIKGKRKINIDPGYISNQHVVLASFKKKNFKKDLGSGVYAHEVLEFKDSNATYFFHTFPDFKSNFMKNFFLKIVK